MPYIKAKSGLNWFFQTQGQGEAVLFIHGWSFEGSVWSKQINYLLPDYGVVTLDLPGHGKSDYKKDVDIIEDVTFIVSELGLGRINLIGHSLGGLISLKLSLRYPELIKSLILIGTPAKFVKSEKHKFGLEEKDINKLRGFISSDYPNILLVFNRWLFTKKERGQDDFRPTWDLVTKRENWPKKEAMGDLLYYLETEDVCESLSNMEIPTLIISGTDDPICPAGSIDYLGRQIKSSKVELFNDCGHLPFLTQPQRFNSLIKRFLR